MPKIKVISPFSLRLGRGIPVKYFAVGDCEINEDELEHWFVRACIADGRAVLVGEAPVDPPAESKALADPPVDPPADPPGELGPPVDPPAEPPVEPPADLPADPPSEPPAKKAKK